jgi:hypothetical protein
MKLQILPADGIYYQWQNADTLNVTAVIYNSTQQAIANWPGNAIDPDNPDIIPGTWIFIPGGSRPLQNFTLPHISRNISVDKRAEYGLGACRGEFDGPNGTETYIWPSPLHEIIGNDFWSGHPGIDIAVPQDTQVFAADTGVVVFAGWANTGHGLTVLIDHGNGWQTLYAHLQEVIVTCGQSLQQSNPIAIVGDIAAPIPAHVHFEIRQNGTPVNPLIHLP